MRRDICDSDEIGCIVHHADVITLKGSSYRLKDQQIATLPSTRAENQAH